MKFSLYIAGLAFIIASCSTTRNFSSIMEDDIYYVPGKKALAIQEVENLDRTTGRSDCLSRGNLPFSR